MYWVYVLQHDTSHELYIGKTDDIKRRVREHNRGAQTSTRRKNGIWKIVYAELYRSRRDADVREVKLKQHGSNKRWLVNRIKHSLLED